MALQEKAMLANLTVRMWSARKRDRKVGQEVEQAHQAKNAGNFNKLLIDKDALKAIVAANTTLRDTHYKLTLPWGDNGDRLLPATMYFEYMKQMRDLIDVFNTSVKDFCKLYPQYRQEARSRLGTMYDPQDYPDASYLSSKFESRISILPIPEAADFRVDLGKDEVDEIRKDIEKQFAVQQEEAIKDLWSRLRDVTERIFERLHNPDAVFRDSLIENAQFACSMASKLNFTENADLETTYKDIQHRLCTVAPQRLRDDKELRRRVAEAAADILKKLPADESV